VVDDPTTLAGLVADPHNRRKHPARNVDMIAASLRTVGAARSIVIDEHGEILAGNGVVEGAAAAGISKLQIVDVEGDTVVAVRRRGLTAEQKRTLAIFDNRTAELAEWNADQLAADRDAGVDLAPFFFENELDDLLRTGARKTGNTDDDAVPPKRATTITRGDLFELGAHRLLCGDSTAPESFERLLRGAVLPLCLTDPPYGVDLGYSTFVDTKQGVSDLARAWLPIARTFAQVVVFSPGVTRQWLYPEPDWVLSWFYGGGQLRSPWGFNCWQPFLAYGKDPSLASGHGCRPDSVDMNTPANAADIDHPCPKPVKLWQWLIDRLSFGDGDAILDPFCGGGTGMVAAETMRRACFGIELDPQYCQVIIDRWEAFTEGTALKVGEAVRP
jgi:DNA methylase